MTHTRALKALRISGQRVSHRNLKHALWQSRHADIIPRLERVYCPGGWFRFHDEWMVECGISSLFVVFGYNGQWLAGTVDHQYLARGTSPELALGQVVKWMKEG